MDDPANLSDIVNRTFGIDLIREKILDYVIHDRNEVLNSNVDSCRLVNKSFHQSVTRILLKCREPLFRFHLTWRNCSTDTPRDQTDNTLVNEFIKLTTSSLGLYHRVPSFSIRVNGWRDENLEQNLFALLTNCGCGLVELDLTFSDHEDPLPLPDNVSFPKLRVLKILDYDVGGREYYVQSILNSSENLQSFTFKYDDCTMSISKNLLLPSSITAVDLDFVLRDNKKLAGRAKNPLPNLKELKLRLLYCIAKSDTGAVITDILKNARGSLQKCCVDVINLNLDRRPRQSVSFKLPLMEKLESLEIEGRHVELEGELSSLEQLVPMLSHMAFAKHTTSMIEKWTKKSCFNNVTSLALDVYFDENEHDNYGDDDEDDDDDVIRPLILAAYPNLQKLDMTLGYSENAMSKLVLLMTKIKTLQHLKIVFKRDDQLTSSDVWDALLVGIQKESLQALMESPSLWKELKKQSTTSIRNLTELQTLELDGQFSKNFSPMSKFAYYFGIFKMPKLSKLILEGAFFSEEVARIATKWQKEKHVISAVGEVIVEKEVFEGYPPMITKSSHFSIKTVLNSV